MNDLPLACLRTPHPRTKPTVRTPGASPSEEIAVWVRTAVQRGCSEIEYTFDGTQGVVRLRSLGRYQSLISIYDDSAFAAALPAAAWNLGRAGADASSSFNQYAHQERQTTGNVGIKVDGYTILALGMVFLREGFATSTLPVGRLLIRVYAADLTVSRPLKELGWGDAHLHRFNRAATLRGGMVVIAGRVGSGTSTTMAALASLRHTLLGDERAIALSSAPAPMPVPGMHTLSLSPSANGHEVDAAINWLYHAGPSFVTIDANLTPDLAKGIVRLLLNGTVVFITAHVISAAKIPLYFSQLLKDTCIDAYDPDLLSVLVSQQLVPKLCPYCSLTLDDALAAEGADRDRLESIASRVYEALDEPPDGDVPIPGGRASPLSAIRFANPSGCGRDQHRNPAGTDGATLVGEIVETTSGLFAGLRDGSHLGEFGMARHALSKIADGTVDPWHIKSCFRFLAAS